MTAERAAPLYTPEMLALAVELADYPLAGAWVCEAELRSRTCGSSVRIGLALRGEEQIDTVGLQSAACAVGQSAAAIFAGDAMGRTSADIDRAIDELEGWLSGSADKPTWARIEQLAPAIPHRGRHEAILLPWRAARAALSNPAAAR